MSEITIIIAFLAGLVSFLSPCVIPLIPGFLGYLAGTNIKRVSRWTLFKHSLLFVLGFSAVFSLLGVLLNSFLSNIAYSTQIWLNRIAGTIIIILGFYLLGFIKLAFLSKEHKFHVKKFKSRELTSFTFGAAFAVGWTPCVGAILAAILALAASMPSQSFLLLFSYSLGLGIPFLLAGLFANKFVDWIQKRKLFFKYFNITAGILIVILGILVFTGKLAVIAGNFTLLSTILN